MNPYSGAQFFTFFPLFFSRLFQGFPGGLAADEMQVLTLALIAGACSLLGPFLVLRKMAMLANSLSHTILFGIALSFLLLGSLSLPSLLLGALFAAVTTALLTSLFHAIFGLQSEASVGLVFTALFSLGALLVTLFTKNVHLGIEAVMGNADALGVGDLWLGLGVFTLNLLLIGLFFHPLRAASFDPEFSRSVKTPSLQILLLFLSATTAVIAFRAVGLILVLALLFAPFLFLKARGLKSALLLSVLIGVAASFGGVALSRHLLTVYGWALSTGGLVVLTLGMGLFFRRALW